MNRGIFLKAIRELLPVTLLLGAILLVMEAILAYVLPTFSRQFTMQIYRVEFVRSIIKAMLGTDLADGIGPMLFVSIPWVHPVTLAVVWAHAMICCTRVPAGEIDRGTIDVLLALPVSRFGLYLTETLAWLISGVVLLACALAGNTLGSSRVVGGIHAPMTHLLIVLANLLAMYLLVGSAAWLFSTLSDRRGRAIGAVFVVVLASFLLNYLAQFWEPAERFAWLGMLRYYRPLFILRDGAWPWSDLGVLLGSALALWTAGAVIFARRDLSTI